MVSAPTIKPQTPPRHTKAWWRALVFAHRWLGISLGGLMLVWAASGIVMMYVAFPAFTDDERVSGLSPINLVDCCNTRWAIGQTLSGATIEMRGDVPTSYGNTATGDRVANDLKSGDRVPPPNQEIAKKTALAFAEKAYGYSGNADVTTIDADQWTVYGYFKRHRPLYKVALEDGAKTVLYVSGTTGQIVQDTTGRERFWNWLGSVPHWVYFTGFRQHQKTWYSFIVWSSLLGVVATTLGITIGLLQFRGGRSKRVSPYRGVINWHHVTGLVFGLFTLTWVTSGLFSMNPWGLMSGGDASAERRRAPKAAFTQVQIEKLIDLLKSETVKDVVSARLLELDGEQYAILVHQDRQVERRRLANAQPIRPDADEISNRIATIRPNASISELSLIDTSDAYYFGHKQRIELPVWRVTMSDNESTLYYLSATTGELVRKVDGPAKQYRWFHYGLHRLDFVSMLR
ncbi:MAG: hypothetical protein AAGH38_03270, partial [Pseudomonadota bacterium]